MNGQITEKEKAGRSFILQELNEKKQKQYEEKWVGKEVEVLFEEVSSKDGKKMITGHTREYLRVSVPCTENGEENWTNHLKKIKIVDISQITH